MMNWIPSNRTMAAWHAVRGFSKELSFTRKLAERDKLVHAVLESRSLFIYTSREQGLQRLGGLQYSMNLVRSFIRSQLFQSLSWFE
jgi:hypothetical protein